MRRLFPQPADDISVVECCTTARPRPADRPYVMLCMVASIDGSTVVDENSRALSSPTDQQMLLTLRTFADVIVVGAGTVRADRYGPPKVPGQRIAVVSRSGRFDFDSPLFTSGAALMILPVDAPLVPVPSVRAGVGEVDLAAAIRMLDAQVVQAEGGPSINGMLAAGDLLDEVNLTVSPRLAGGDGPRVTNGGAAVSHRMHLAQVCEADDGFLFTRYLRAR
ncbi:MAG: dihydrofolate reductase family protein [Actinomycetota bacterium]|nr:dihydrofolate reductase family protein [Actinomycetota bacterium]